VGYYDGLVAVDMRRPDAPQVLDSEWVLGNPDSVAVHEGRVFLGTGLFGVAVMDAGDPGALTWVEQIVPDDGSHDEGPVDAVAGASLGASVVDVSVSGNHLLVADAEKTVWIYAVGSSGRAMRVGRYASSIPVEDTAVHGSTLYVTDGHEALEVVDITVATSPNRLTVTHGPEWEVSARYGSDMMVQRRVGGGIRVVGMEEVVRRGDEWGRDEDDFDDDDDGHECEGGDHGREHHDGGCARGDADDGHAGEEDRHAGEDGGGGCPHADASPGDDRADTAESGAGRDGRDGHGGGSDAGTESEGGRDAGGDAGSPDASHGGRGGGGGR
jgi:hypothetical protein